MFDYLLAWIIGVRILRGNYYHPRKERKMQVNEKDFEKLPTWAQDQVARVLAQSHGGELQDDTRNGHDPALIPTPPRRTQPDPAQPPPPNELLVGVGWIIIVVGWIVERVGTTVEWLGFHLSRFGLWVMAGGRTIRDNAERKGQR